MSHDLDVRRPDGHATAPPRTGAFSRVRVRWLPLWFAGGLALASLGLGIYQAAGVTLSDDWFGILLYLPLVAWVLVMVGARAGVHLPAMFRWPRLGWYWWVIVGMCFVQFLFAIGAATLTQLVFPGLADSLEGLGEGNLVLAIVGLVILPPLVEETVFRGVLIERFAVKWNVRVAILVSAVAFGILHVDPVGAGMFGVITALLYLRTGSLWPGILIHAVNNGASLASIRLATDAAAETPTTGESLMTAAVCLAIAVPFLVWFLRVHWPSKQAWTPYQRFEGVRGLPERTFRSVGWSGLPGLPMQLTANATHLALSAQAAPTRPLAVLPVDHIQTVYCAPVPGGDQVVVLLRDGSWTTLQASGGVPARNRELMFAIAERAKLGQVEA